MSGQPGRVRRRRGPAVRVAAVTTLIIAIVYVTAMIFVNVIAGNRLTAGVDAQLVDTLGDAGQRAGFAAATLPDDADEDAASLPVLLWRVSGSGRVLAASDGAPRLPGTVALRPGQAETVRLGTAPFRLQARRTVAGWLVAGQSLTEVEHIQQVLLAAEVVAAPVLLASVFLGTLLIGLKASEPVEQARRRQLEFTADASHELRTPLSVIEAEAGLALSTPRDPAQYVRALRRVAGESRRLRTIIDDLLWLARFDVTPANPASEPVDVVTIAEVCADRFSAIASARGIEMSVRAEGDPQAWITAPPEWVDRLTGVLVDNACRHAPGSPGDPAAHPAVHLAVACHSGRVSLTVEDTGPGIPEHERARLFDRFYRATSNGGGYGLGLAIADTVVRATGGKWRIDDSPLGGASMRVTWHRSGHPHRSGQTRRLVAPGPAGAAPGPAARAPGHPAGGPDAGQQSGA